MLEIREQEITAKNLNEISFYFFFIIGLIHIISGLLLANEYLIQTTWLLNRLLDIPFLIVTLIYLYSTLKIYLINKKLYTSSTDLFFSTLFFFIAFFVFMADLIFSNQLPTLN